MIPFVHLVLFAHAVIEERSLPAVNVVDGAKAARLWSSPDGLDGESVEPEAADETLF